MIVPPSATLGVAVNVAVVVSMVSAMAVVAADVYGTGGRGVVLAHGGRFDKSSWKTQAQALADGGFRVVRRKAEFPRDDGRERFAAVNAGEKRRVRRGGASWRLDRVAARARCPRRHVRFLG